MRGLHPREAANSARVARWPGTRRTRTIAAAVALAAIAVLAACGSSSSTSPSANSLPAIGPQTASVATIHLVGPGTTNNIGYPTPYASNRGPGWLLTSFMFDQLTWPDSTGVQKPWLAKSWTTSADGKTWTFTLRSNATWQDGQQLTAQDVLFSYQYDMTGPGAKLRPVPKSIAAVSAPDPQTFVITLSRVDPILLDEIGGFSGVFIVPQHIWANVTDPAHFQGQQALVGSGPYQLTSFDLSQGNYQYTAYNNFYLGKPIVQKVTLVSLPSTADPLTALTHNQVDAASAPNTGGGVTDAELKSLQQQFPLLQARGEYNVAYHFNLASGFPYNSQQFRQAVAYAINRNSIVQREVSGRGVPGSAGGLGPANPWLDKTLPQYNYDPAKAKSLLDSVGLKAGSGGTRTMPDGSPLAIPLLTSSTDLDFAQFVKNDLAAVGLTVNIQAVDQASSDASDAAGKYTTAVIHYGGLSADPSTRICGTYVPATGGKPASFAAAQGYNNATVNSLCNQIGSTLDHATRQNLANQLQQTLNTDVAVLPLYVPDQVAFVDTKAFTAWSFTPGCPPCGVSESKFMLATGKLKAS
jgi:peptide/nickel transport system substrate-binding protein